MSVSVILDPPSLILAQVTEAFSALLPQKGWLFIGADLNHVLSGLLTHTQMKVQNMTKYFGLFECYPVTTR